MNENNRSEPKQRRSRDTIDFILDGTAQLLERLDGTRVTTAKVAERAGFSIGTVYRYFRDKRSLFLALVQREIERTVGRVERALRDNPDVMGQDLVLVVINEVLRPFDSRLETQRQINGIMMADTEYRQLLVADVMAAFGRVMDLMKERDPDHFGSIPEDEYPLLFGLFFGPVWVSLRMGPSKIHQPAFAKRLARMLYEFNRPDMDEASASARDCEMQTAEAEDA